MPAIDLIVLAGGFGTRLRSAVATVPKPLAPVQGRPYLDHMVDHWLAQGVRSFTFLLHHQAELIEDYLHSRRRAGGLDGCVVRTLTEPHPLGTGGAVAHAVQQLSLSGTFLVANADTWLGSGIAQVEAANAPAMAVVHVDDCGRYGSVRVEAGKVIAFEEKRADGGPGWINAGLYRLGAVQFQDWDGRAFSLERELFPRWVAAGELQAVPLRTEFIDIGVPAEYLRFCRWIELEKAGIP